MNNKPKSFKAIQRDNRLIVKRDFIKAIKKYQPEQAILIMGKHILVEGEENKYKYTMNITENIVPERIENFINTITAETIRLKQQRKLWTPLSN